MRDVATLITGGCVFIPWETEYKSNDDGSGAKWKSCGFPHMAPDPTEIVPFRSVDLLRHCCGSDKRRNRLYFRNYPENRAPPENLAPPAERGNDMISR